MFKRKFHTMIKRSLAGMLCAGLLVTQPAAIYAAEASATATPEAGHSATYSQAADTDSIKGWPAGPSIEGQSAVLLIPFFIPRILMTGSIQPVSLRS